MATASVYEPAMGFSQYTSLPRRMASMDTGACMLLCRHTSTASMSGSPSISAMVA